MTNDARLKVATIDYVFPPECCRCNVARGDSPCTVETMVGRKRPYTAYRMLAVPLCHECALAIDREALVRAQEMRGRFKKVLLLGGSFLLVRFTMVASGLSLGVLELPVGMLSFVALVACLVAIAMLPMAKAKCEREKLHRTVRGDGSGGLVFANKEYEARVTRTTSTLVLAS